MNDKTAQPAATAKAAAEANPNQSTKSAVNTATTTAVKAPHPTNDAPSKEDHGEPETISEKELEALIGTEAMQNDSNADNALGATGDVDEETAYRARQATQKLESIVKALPTTTPDSHILFGYANINITVGDLRHLFGA